LNDIGRPVAGKTGTTNDYKDAWFIGFTPDLVVGTYIGFDEPKSLGKGETGGTAAVPIVREFLVNALKDKPATPFRVPSGLTMLKVNARNGQITNPTDPAGIWEAFLPGTEPGAASMVVLDSGGVADDNANNVNSGFSNQAPDSTTPTIGTGGIY
jgi:penicillin-binding protein 1A